MEAEEQNAAYAEAWSAVGHTLFDIVERKRDFADDGEVYGHIRRLYLFPLWSNYKKTRGFAGFFLRNRGWKHVAEVVLACCNRFEFPVCFLHESGISGKHVLFPMLYGTGTCVFWRREAEELSIRP